MTAQFTGMWMVDIVATDTNFNLEVYYLGNCAIF